MPSKKSNLEKAKSSDQQSVAIFSEAAMRHNLGVLEYSRTCQAAATGIAAGILGLTSVPGFIFYFVVVLLQALFWEVKANLEWQSYFIDRWASLSHSLISGLFTYILFWVFFYGMRNKELKKLRMSGAKDLQRRCDEYQKKVTYLEGRLKDVVKAYKGLESEKQALEAVVCKEVEKEEDAPQHLEDQSPVSSMVMPSDATVESMKKAFAMLVKEKIRRETALQADKKFLVSELETVKNRVSSLEVELKEVEEEKEKVIDDFTKHVQKYKEQMLLVKMELEKERDGYGNSLAAIQAEYAAEKRNVEHLNKKLAEAYTQMHHNEETGLKKREKELKDEIAKWQKQAEEWKAKAAKTPTLQLLQDQIANLKATHKHELHEAMMEARKKLELEEFKECRESSLEATVQRLAAELAASQDYRLRVEQESRALKVQLETLHQVVEKNKSVSEDPVQRLRSAVEYMKEKRPNADIRGLLGCDSVLLQESHAKLNAVKEEFERYKLKAEAVLKSKTATSGSAEGTRRGGGEEEGLRMLVTQLHNKLSALEAAHSSDQTLHEQTTKNMREKICELERSEEVNRQEMRRELAARVSEMEEEMVKQRERTLYVLAEKERELEATRSILVSVRSDQLNSTVTAPPPADPPHGRRRGRSGELRRERAGERKYSNESTGGSSRGFGQSFDGTTALSSVVEQLPSGNEGGRGESRGEGRNIFYEEEISKKDREIAELRVSVNQLDHRVREAEQGRLCRDLQQHEQLERLKEEIRVLEGKLALETSGNGESQYLRNIFVQYLQCDSASAKKKILKAIGTVLKLSQNEMKVLDKLK